MIGWIDDVLDRVTMYRLVLYYLLVLLAAAFAFSILGTLPVAPLDLAVSILIVIGIAWVTNVIFARAFAVPESFDSVIITALIVVLIMSPARFGDANAVGVLVFTAVWAMASKYIFAIARRHIFNPAAVAAAMAGLFLDQPPTWWVARCSTSSPKRCRTA